MKKIPTKRLSQQYTKEEVSRIEAARKKAMITTKAGLIKAAVAEYLGKLGV